MNSYNKQIEAYIKSKVGQYNRKLKKKKKTRTANTFGVPTKKKKGSNFIRITSIKRKKRRGNNTNNNNVINKFQNVSSVKFTGDL